MDMHTQPLVNSKSMYVGIVERTQEEESPFWIKTRRRHYLQTWFNMDIFYRTIEEKIYNMIQEGDEATLFLLKELASDHGVGVDRPVLPFSNEILALLEERLEMPKQPPIVEETSPENDIMRRLAGLIHEKE